MSPLLRRRSRGPALLVHGHSLALGAGTSDPSRRATRLLADRLGLVEDNRAVGGAIAHWETTGGVGDGGWPLVLSDLPDGGAAGPLRDGGMGLLWYGVNDLGALGPRMRPYEEALRTMIGRYRAATVAPPGPAAPAEWLVNGRRGAITAGLTVASDARATVRLAAAGSTALELRLDGSELCFPERRNAVVARIAAIPAGAESLALELDVEAGTVTHDYWQSEAADPPPVAVLTQFPLANYDVYAGWPGDPVMDDHVTGALNPATRRVAAEFPGVVCAEIEDAFPEGYRVHHAAYPDDDGYARIAALLAQQAEAAAS